MCIQERCGYRTDRSLEVCLQMHKPCSEVEIRIAASRAEITKGSEKGKQRLTAKLSIRMQHSQVITNIGFDRCYKSHMPLVDGLLLLPC
jgi:hypothetical protein